MSLVTLPNEMIVEIGTHLIPNFLKLQLANKHFSEWPEIVAAQGPIIALQAKDFYALGQTCKILRDALSKKNPSHVHVKDFKSKLVDLVLGLPEVKSLSTHNFIGMDHEIALVNKRLSADNPFIDLTVENPYLNSLGTVNSSIHTLYLLSSATSQEILDWLLEKLAGMRILYMDFENPETVVGHSNMTINALVAVLQEHAKRIEKLVLTMVTDEADDWYFSNITDSFVGVRMLANLTSLKIGSFYLLGSVGLTTFKDRKKVHKLLPSSLVELDVVYDDAANWPFMYSDENGASGFEPTWIFRLLENKSKYTPNLERFRLSSQEILPNAGATQTWWYGQYTSMEDDWVPDDGYRCWKPPVGLIDAFAKAKVSFGIFLQPCLGYKVVVSGSTWFEDNWEEEWCKGCKDIDASRDDFSDEEASVGTKDSAVIGLEADGTEMEGISY